MGDWGSETCESSGLRGDVVRGRRSGCCGCEEEEERVGSGGEVKEAVEERARCAMESRVDGDKEGSKEEEEEGRNEEEEGRKEEEEGRKEEEDEGNVDGIVDEESRR